MKTIDKRSIVNKKLSDTHQLLIDHPTHEHLIPENSQVKAQKIEVLDGLILHKKQSDKYRRELQQLLFLIGLSLSLLLIILAFEWKFYADKQLVNLSAPSENMIELMDIPPTEQPPPPPPKLEQPQIVEVANEEEIIEEIEFDLDVEVTEESSVENYQVEVTVEEEPEEEVSEEVFTIVEQKPEPNGGFAAFYAYVGDNLKYPSQAARLGIEGKVFVQFIVEKDGSLTDIQVVKGIGAGCDEEAVRVIKNSPRWNPGKQRGVPVRVKMIFPIVFKLMER